jgi:epoxide hydrolase 4
MSTTGGGTSGASGTAVQQAAGLLGSEVREGYAEIGDVRLHYVEAGEGPLIVLLHGLSASTSCSSTSSRPPC